MEIFIFSPNLELYIKDSLVFVDYLIDQLIHIYSKFDLSETF